MRERSGGEGGASSFDHLPFGVADVDATRSNLAALGFTATATGVCRWTLRGRSHEARAISVVFEDAYLDLIEIREAGWLQHLSTSPLYARGLASTGIVLRAAPIAQARARLAASGFAVGEQYQITRELAGAEPPQIQYEIFSLRDEVLPFAVIEDSAPRAMRTEDWLRHPNTAIGVRSFHLRVPSLAAWLSRAGALLGEAVASSGSAELDLGSATLVVHEEPRDPYLGALSALLPRHDRPALLAIELSVADLDAVRSRLGASRTPAIELDGGFAVEPTCGYGCGVVFLDVGRGEVRWRNR